MQWVSSRIWTRVAVSNSYDDNDYTTGTSQNDNDYTTGTSHALMISSILSIIPYLNSFVWFHAFQANTDYVYTVILFKVRIPIK